MSVERMTRPEMDSMKYGSACLSNLMFFEKDLQKRIGSLPDGPERMRKVIEGFQEIFGDICDTMPEKQRTALANIFKDTEVRIVPKMTPRKVTVTWDKASAMEIVDAAGAKCEDCFKDEQESQSCRLRHLFEVCVPLDRYSALSCPYKDAIWEDE